ncbi:MAG: poly-gamma-glutamate biosynthesis protein PgsC/CapC [Alphaproteobacteria bacterium]|nr:poly-gamma-glutamate biosynthesis protein PgsC/CapC [Alphaproteobacteria bacterium]
MILELFPASSLDSSILTSVLVGLLVVWVLQETLGWGFSGLVIPGYLASILVIQPLTGAVVVGEAVLTWAIVEGLSERTPAWWPWAPLFGRDRFFQILLVSVGVRVALEGGGFAALLEGLSLGVSEELHSMGLVLVPLIANALWRSGLAAGAPRLGIPLLITWGILEFGLLRHTNLSLSNFELTYEDLALNFVGSPRAYILLLVGAYVASAVNLRWGWDFGGIVVPGLLTLCWLEPGKLAATLGEAVVIAAVYRAALRLPVLRGWEMTGGRPLVLAFTLAYLLKMALAWVGPAAWPGLRPTELFGFGYLLPTLVALRIVKHGDALRVLIPTTVTSLGGFAAGTALGYAVAAAMPAAPGAPSAPNALLEGAWRGQGPTPAFDAPGLYVGGDGFGALQLRADGAPLAVSARVGPVGLSGAALAVAEALDARAVHLCGPAGDGCDAGRQALARRMDLLVVEAGRTTTLAASGALPEPLDLRRLGALAPRMPVVAGGATPTLKLSLADRLRARPGDDAVAVSDVHGFVGPSFAEDPAQAGWRKPTVPAEEVAALWDLTLRPWAWRTLRTGAPGEQAAPDQDSGLRALHGAGWRALLAPGGSGLVVHAPDVLNEPDTAALAGVLFEALDASALVLAAPSPHPTGVGSPPEGPVASPAHAALLAILEALGPQARVLSVRGYRDVLDPGAEAVLSLGRPALPGQPRPAFAEDLEARLAARGVSTAWYDGDARRLSFQDPGDPARAAAEAATGVEAHVTLFASSAWRRAVAAGRGEAW